MRQLKVVAVVMLLFIAFLFVYDLLFSDRGGHVVYRGDVVSFFPLNVNEEAIDNLEVVKYKGKCYSYMLLKKQEDLGKILLVPYKKTDFEKHNLLAVKICGGRGRLIGTPVISYGCYKIKWKLNRLYIELYPRKRGGSYNLFSTTGGSYRFFGIEIPKEYTRITEYIEKGKKVYIVAP